MRFLSTLAVAAFATLPFAAQAQNIVAGDAASVKAFFLDEGATVSEDTDSVGDPRLEVEYYGNEFWVYYYGCEDNKNCNAVQFFSGYQTDGAVRLAKVNEWNTDNRYARAYISEAGAARIEMDVFLGRKGVSPDDFAQMVGLWNSSMNEFETFIDW